MWILPSMGVRLSTTPSVMDWLKAVPTTANCIQRTAIAKTARIGVPSPRTCLSRSDQIPSPCCRCTGTREDHLGNIRKSPSRGCRCLLRSADDGTHPTSPMVATEGSDRNEGLFRLVARKLRPGAEFGNGCRIWHRTSAVGSATRSQRKKGCESFEIHSPRSGHRWVIWLSVQLHASRNRN